MAIAEAAVAIRRGRERVVPASWRSAAYVLAVVASNVPDLDLLLVSITPGRLGYLLHHRGHTHTLVAQLGFAAALLCLTWLITRLRVRLWERRDWLWLAGLALVCGVGHLGFDALNSYGVHVFWPWDNRWSYGDVLFILDPSLWLALAVPLISAARSSNTRLILRGISLLALGLLWFSGYVPSSVAAVITLLAALARLVTRRFGDGREGWVALSGAAVLIGVFAFSSARVRSELKASYAATFPDGQIEDIVLASTPANPVCWRAIVVSREGRRYVLRDGLLSAYPWWLPTDACPHMWKDGIAPLIPETVWTMDSTEWRGTYAVDLEAWRVFAQRCDVQAFLRFSRAPFMHADHLGVGDLRFDNGGENGFSDLALNPDGACPSHVPPWDMPRAFLMH